MKLKKIIWFIIIPVLALAAVGYFWQKEKGAEKITLRTDKIDRGDVVVSISATGTLNADTTVTVGTQVSGTISKLYADFNSVVEKGQLLAQLDSTFLKAAVNQQRANLSRAKAQVNESQRNYDRTVKLADKSLVSQADLDAATADLESNKATLEQAQAALEQAEVNLRYATIKAPISGVIVSRNVDVGQTVAASLQAPTIFTIANDLKKMQVQASVGEADIGSVEPRQKVTFHVDAYPDKEFEGTVNQIRLAPITNSGVVTYNVIIDVNNPEQKLLPGMTATVTIEVARADNVLRVPLAALKFTPSKEILAAYKAADPAGPPPDSTKRSMRHMEGAMASPNAGNNMEGGNPEAWKGRGNRPKIWSLENGQLVSYPVKRGIQGTRYVEVSGPNLTEGMEIITGTNGGTSATTTGQTQRSPFMPQMPGGPPGRR